MMGYSSLPAGAPALRFTIPPCEGQAYWHDGIENTDNRVLICEKLYSLKVKS